MAEQGRLEGNMGWREDQLRRAEELRREMSAGEELSSVPVKHAEKAHDPFEKGDKYEAPTSYEDPFSAKSEEPYEVDDGKYDLFGRLVSKPEPTRIETPESVLMEVAPHKVSLTNVVDDDMEGEHLSEEARRKMDGWANPSSGLYLEGYVASSIEHLEEYEVRPGLRRWLYSFFNFVSYPRHRVGARFLLRSDDVNKWERNVLVYGEVYGGSIHKGSNVRVRGKLDRRSGDIIAREIICTDTFSGGRMTISGVIPPGVVWLLTMLGVAVITFALRFILALVAGVPVLMDQAQNYFLEHGAMIIIILIIVFYIMSRFGGNRRRRRGRRRRWF